MRPFFVYKRNIEKLQAALSILKLASRHKQLQLQTETVHCREQISNCQSDNDGKSRNIG